MPRFYFDFSAGEGWTFDDEGYECESPAHARERAVTLRPTLAGKLPRNGGHRTLVVRIRDEAERILDQIEAPVRPPY